MSTLAQIFYLLTGQSWASYLILLKLPTSVVVMGITQLLYMKDLQWWLHVAGALYRLFLH